MVGVLVFSMPFDEIGGRVELVSFLGEAIGLELAEQGKRFFELACEALAVNAEIRQGAVSPRVFSKNHSGATEVARISATATNRAAPRHTVDWRNPKSAGGFSFCSNSRPLWSRASTCSGHCP